ncbi:MAG: anhydro-N-acetylmuramic acid kinase [Flavobacteriales bacterium]|nr:anhydro-N-acetylmuramic acid kinase [Candidatus Arcticimaribacter sp.]
MDLKQKSFCVVGVMSGTSLDGLDLALVKFNFIQNKWNYRFISTITKPYDSIWVEKLSEARFLSENRLVSLDNEYTSYLANQIQLFIDQNANHEIDLICSHGHTVHHQPDKGITVQIGNQSKLSVELKKTVVCDFRVQDVALGGQGAPLVPGGEFYLFSDYAACVNLGGFANITLVNKKEKLQAFDIAAANLVFNQLASRLDLPYDSEGKIASKGSLIPELLAELNALNYFSQASPKSLGVEWVSQHIEPILNVFNQESIPDLMHTYAVHLADQISKVLPNSGKILFSGGGTHNSFLMQQMEKNSTSKVCIPSKVLIDFKEAMIFGFLGLLRFLGDNNCFSSVTGSSRDHSTGVLFENK